MTWRLFIGKNVCERFFVFVANIFDQFCIEHDVQVPFCIPWTRVHFAIIDGQVNLHAAVVGATDALDRAAVRSKRVSLEVEPQAVFVSDSLYYQRVAFPMSDPIAFEAWEGSLGSGRPSRKIWRLSPKAS